jgi:hypothetical protein
MEYKEFNLSYIDQVIDLLNLCFPEKKITKKSFLWKYCNNFFNGKSLGMIAVDNEKVCAFVYFTPIYITNNKETLNFYLCAIQCTHPKYRRKGIISDLTQIIEKKIGDNVGYLGFSNNSGIKIDRYSKKIQYKILGKFSKKYVLSFLYKTNLEIKKVDKISKEIIYNSNYFGILKNIDYLNWRYLNNPKRKYEYFEIRDKKVTIGYLVCISDRIKYEVLDLLLNNYDPSIVNLAIRSFAKFAFVHGKLFVSYSYLPNNFWNKCFPILSFSRTIPFYLTIKANNNDLNDVNNLIFQGGDIQ